MGVIAELYFHVYFDYACSCHVPFQYCLTFKCTQNTDNKENIIFDQIMRWLLIEVFIAFHGILIKI